MSDLVKITWTENLTCEATLDRADVVVWFNLHFDPQLPSDATVEQIQEAFDEQEDTGDALAVIESDHDEVDRRVDSVEAVTGRREAPVVEWVKRKVVDTRTRASVECGEDGKDVFTSLTIHIAECSVFQEPIRDCTMTDDGGISIRELDGSWNHIDYIKELTTLPEVEQYWRGRVGAGVPMDRCSCTQAV